MTEKHIALEVSQDEHYNNPYLKSLKENWPSLSRDYRHYCHTHHPKIGEVWTWTSPEGQKFFHLIMDEKNQAPHNGATRLKAFKHALKSLKKEVIESPVNTIELPKLGFHFSNDEFEIANSLIKEAFIDSEIEVRFV